MNLSKKEEINKLLIIRLSSIGDIILTTPFIRACRKAFPNSRIDVLTGAGYAEICKNLPYVTEIFRYDKSLPAFSQGDLVKTMTASGKYDVVFDLQTNLRTRAITNDIGLKTFRYKKNRLHKISLVRFNRPLIQDYSVVKNYFTAGEKFGLVPDAFGCEIRLDDENDNLEYPPFVREIRKDSKSVSFAPGAKHFTKRWQKEKFAELAVYLIKQGFNEIFLLGGSEDAKLCREINHLSGNVCINKAGQISLVETAGIIDKSRIVISNDTGLMHIAAARQVPVVAIFGSSVKELGFSPYKSPAVIIEKKLKCRPCSHVGKDRCPLGHFDCMNKISVGDVIKSIGSLL